MPPGGKVACARLDARTLGLLPAPMVVFFVAGRMVGGTGTCS